MINADIDKGTLHIEGTIENCFSEWMTITSSLYTSVTKNYGITKASLLFSEALVEACKKGAEDLETEND